MKINNIIGWYVLLLQLEKGEQVIQEQVHQEISAACGHIHHHKHHVANNIRAPQHSLQDRNGRRGDHQRGRKWWREYVCRLCEVAVAHWRLHIRRYIGGVIYIYS